MVKDPVLAAIDQKLKDGKALTPEEVKEVMSMPNSSETFVAPDDEDPEKIFESMEDDKGNPVNPDGSPKPASKAKEAAPAPASATPPAPTPPAAATPAPAAAVPEEDISDILIELEKPESEADPEKLSPKKKGIYWEMRRERKRRQDLETENAQLQHKLIQGAKKEEELPEEGIVLEGEDGDIPTKGELRKVFASLKKATTKASESLTTEADAEKNLLKDRYLAMCDAVARDKYTDYDEVLECTPEIAANNPAYAREVAKAIINGDNPAIKAYNLIKGDPKFLEVAALGKARVAAKASKKTPAQAPAETPAATPAPAAPAKEAPETVKAAEAQIEKNTQKTKTSGSFPGGGDAPGGQADKYTFQQIASMSPVQFARLPKKERDYYFNKYAKN